MSLSRNRDIFNSKFMILSIVIFTVFTVSLTENLQISDGFLSQSTAGWVYELNPGESQVLTWTLINSEDVVLDIEFRGEGQGSELFVFEELVTMEAGESRSFEFIVIVPEDHPDNVEYRPILFALEKARQDSSGGAAVLINYQMSANPVIKIGDDPVFTPEPKPVAEEEKEPEPVVESSQVEIQITPAETLEEKLARIQAANEANQITTDDKTITDVGSEENKEVTTESSKIIPDEGFIPEPISDEISEGEGGGCLIATAAYGSEMAPQVQLLREIRDNQLMNTESGSSFMTGFNQLYYSFSPTIADLERNNPIFQEFVKLAITPMISTLSIMQYADSESEVLGYGISLIILNLGMYIGIPAIGIVKVFQIRRK